MYFYHA
ncbi:CPXV212 protein [Cowpox virus]|nr:CPXV212 protein [Cowpox virus]ATB55477.1 CPXV212 protein [Cowpox virus]ATB55691.1 CPXV212 protein [Cowpox virus]ATB55906.1 CPXV212 protein [Cowpox virus]ATB56121.1 CPXV212 protein [Cowpox virus]